MNYTFLSSFNYRTGEIKNIFNIPKDIYLTNYNSNDSLLTTQRPFQIYSLKSSSPHLLVNSSFSEGISDLSISKSLCWNYNEMVVENFNPTTNTITITKTIDAPIDNSVIQILTLIEYGNFICTFVLIVAVLIISKKEGLWSIDFSE